MVINTIWRSLSYVDIQHLLYSFEKWMTTRRPHFLYISWKPIWASSLFVHILDFDIELQLLDKDESVPRQWSQEWPPDGMPIDQTHRFASKVRCVVTQLRNDELTHSDGLFMKGLKSIQSTSGSILF